MVSFCGGGNVLFNYNLNVMADSEQLIVRVQTYENALTERTDDYVGKVLLNGYVDMEDLAEDIIPVVGNVQYETIVGIAKRLTEAAVKRLKMGCTVNFGICHARPVVKGPFFGRHPQFDPEINSIQVAMSPTQAVREGMANIPVEMIGQAVTGPIINTVTDVKTGEVDGQITPNRNLKIFGSRVEIAGEAEENGVYFVSLAEGAERVKVDPTDIVDNKPSQLTILVPALEKGEYYLEIITQFSSRSTTTKASRTYRFEQVLSVV